MTKKSWRQETHKVPPPSFSTARQKLISWQNLWTHRHLICVLAVLSTSTILMNLLFFCEKILMNLLADTYPNGSHLQWWRMGIRNSQSRRFISKATSYLPPCSKPIPLLPLLRRWREANEYSARALTGGGRQNRVRVFTNAVHASVPWRWTPRPCSATTLVSWIGYYYLSCRCM
jgi:hypothetical protein